MQKLLNNNPGDMDGGAVNAGPANSNHYSLINVAEIISVAGAIGGSIAGVVTQQFLLAVVPLSVAAGLNLLNRKRLVEESHEENQNAIAELAQENVRNQMTQRVLKERVAEVQHLISGPEHSIRQLKQATKTLNRRQKSLATTVDRLRALEEYNQAIHINPQDVDAYYRRGNTRFYLGNIQGAIEDYKRTLELNPNHAQSLRNRSVLYRRLGEHKGAIDDLRRAARLFFEAGNMEQYQQAVDTMKSLYKLAPPSEDDIDIRASAAQPVASGVTASAASHVSSSSDASDSENITVENLFA